MKKVIITGSAGFIGFHTALRFLKEGFKVYGIDDLNDYYDPNLKEDRNKILEQDKNFNFIKADISKVEIKNKYNEINPELFINLAAQAGVRHSITNPEDYIKANIDSFLHIMEFAKDNKNLVRTLYASTSSVYGGNIRQPFQESHGVDHPLQFYAVSKRTNELMAHAYSNLYGTECIGLRFFTVYGPWGRPDMALFKFTKNILEDKEIDVYNNGNHSRDFTYVDDIVEGIYLSSISKKELIDSNFNSKDPSRSFCKSIIFNLGRGKPENLEDFIDEIENNLGKTAKRNLMPLQPGDVPDTSADISSLKDFSGYEPKTSIKIGVKNFIDWYKEYYKVNL